MRHSNALRLALVIALVVGIGWLGWELYSAGYLSRERLVAVAGDAGAGAPLLIIGALVLAVVIGPIPTIPITVASGVLFGPWLGFIYAVIGSLAGAAAAFWIARLAGRPLVERWFRGHISFCADCSGPVLFWLVAACRLVPVVSFAAVSYGAGLTAMRTGTFLLATALGMTPMTLLYVAIGTGLRFDPVWTAIGGSVAFALLLGLPRLIERYNPFGIVQLLPHGRDPH